MKKTAALSVLMLILSGALVRAEDAAPKYTQAELKASPYLKSVVTREGTMADASKFKKKGPYKIALAAQGPTNSWAALFDQEARYHVDQLGKDKISALLYASADGSADKQVPEVEDLLSQNPDALILVPMGRAALAAPVDRAAAQGVPVVLCASGVDGDSYVTEVGTNLYDLGVRMANWLSDQLKGSGQILVMDGIPGVDTAEIAKAGAASVWRNKPGVKILDEQYGQWSTSVAKKIAEQWIAKYGKDIQGIWRPDVAGHYRGFPGSQAPGSPDRQRRLQQRLPAAGQGRPRHLPGRPVSECDGHPVHRHRAQDSQWRAGSALHRLPQGDGEDAGRHHGEYR